jgi:hypothetical protein
MDVEKFMEFDAEHPEFYERFEKIALRLIKNGRTHYSAYAICDYLRMNTELNHSSDFPPFKLSNNFRKGFALKFVKRHPEHMNFFTFHDHGNKYQPDQARKIAAFLD